MAEEVLIGRIVAEARLDNSNLIENAEQSEQKLRELGQAIEDNKKQRQNSNLVIARAAKELKALQRQAEENGGANEEQKNKIAQLRTLRNQLNSLENKTKI